MKLALLMTRLPNLKGFWFWSRQAFVFLYENAWVLNLLVDTPLDLSVRAFPGMFSTVGKTNLVYVCGPPMG